MAESCVFLPQIWEGILLCVCDPPALPGPVRGAWLWAAPEGDSGALLGAGWGPAPPGLPSQLAIWFLSLVMSTDLDAGARAPFGTSGQGCTQIPGSSIRLRSCALRMQRCALVAAFIRVVDCTFVTSFFKNFEHQFSLPLLLLQSYYYSNMLRVL